MKKIFFNLIFSILTVSSITINNYAKSESISLYPFKAPSIDKYGYINSAGNIVFEAEFDEAREFNQGIVIYRKGNFYGFINRQGQLIEPLFTEIRGLSENKICAKKGNKWSYFDLNGRQTVNKTFDDAYLYSNGLARVLNNDRYGYINSSGNYIGKANFDYAENFSDNVAYASYANKDATFINNQGKFVLTTKNDYIYSFYEGLAVFAGNNNRYGYINKQKKEITKPIFQFADRFYEGLARVKINNKWGFINNKGNYIVTPKYDQLNNFSEGLAAFRVGNSWGFIDRDARVVISPEFQLVNNFSENLASVKINGIWGYIGIDGRFVINPRFEEADSFSNGLAAVSNYSYIDKTGQYIWSPSEYAEKTRARIKFDNDKYNLRVGQNICVNQWGASGFCGTIQNVLDDKYTIKVSSINCNGPKCPGVCADNLISVSSDLSRVRSIIDKGLFTVEIYKDCITSY